MQLEDPQVISVGDLDVVKVEFDPASHHPTQVASYLTNYSNNKAYIVTPASPVRMAVGMCQAEIFTRFFVGSVQPTKNAARHSHNGQYRFRRPS